MTSHPASNGMVERAVQIFKKGLKKISTGSLSEQMAKILMSYRLDTPDHHRSIPCRATVGKKTPFPSLDLLKPHTTERVESKQLKQKEQHDMRWRRRTLQAGDEVFVRNFHCGSRWLPGVIERTTGPVSYVVKLTDGRSRRCHHDQMQTRTICSESTCGLG